MTKICNTCKTLHPMDSFTKSAKTADGYAAQCRSCRSAYVSKRRADPSVRLKETAYSAQWYQANKEHKAKQSREWRQNNLSKARESVNKYAAEHRAQKRQADQTRYHQNLELSRAAGRAKYAKNSLACSAAVKLWRAANTDLVRAWGRAWAQVNKEKYAARAEHRRKLKEKMSEFDRFVMHEAAKLCALRKAATQVDWQIDHIVPLAKGGTHVCENIQVVPAVWNAAKRDRHCERFFG